MREDNTEVLVELWEKLQEFITVNKRDDAAYTFLSTILLNESLDIDKFELIESNQHLETAYEQYRTSEEYSEDDIEDEIETDELPF